MRLEVVDEDTLRMAAGNRFASIDELMVYTRDAAGAVVSVRGDSGMTHRPWTVPTESPEVAAALV